MYQVGTGCTYYLARPTNLNPGTSHAHLATQPTRRLSSGSNTACCSPAPTSALPQQSATRRVQLTTTTRRTSRRRSTFQLYPASWRQIQLRMLVVIRPSPESTTDRRKRGHEMRMSDMYQVGTRCTCSLARPINLTPGTSHAHLASQLPRRLTCGNDTSHCSRRETAKRLPPARRLAGSSRSVPAWLGATALLPPPHILVRCGKKE